MGFLSCSYEQIWKTVYEISTLKIVKMSFNSCIFSLSETNNLINFGKVFFNDTIFLNYCAVEEGFDHKNLDLWCCYIYQKIEDYWLPYNHY